MEQQYNLSSCDNWPHVAFLCLTETTRGGADWLTCCYQVTPRVEWLSATAVTMDVGICTDHEAQRVLCSLIRRLDTLGVATRVGMAPTPALAQLVLLAEPHRQRLVSVSPAEAPALVRRLPVAILAQLLPSGAITGEVIKRLHRYGLHTLGHVATLSEQSLRQQFGRAAGATLAALAQGRDPLPFCPTPAPQRLHFRMRCSEAATPQRVLAALPTWTKQIAATLQRAELAVRELRLVVGWDDGRYVAARTVLRQHIADAETLLAAVHGLLLPVLQHEEGTAPAGGEQLLNSVRLTLLDVAPIRPAQDAFWQVRPPRRAAFDPVAEALARRHGRTLLVAARPVALAAIFPEERYRLDALASSTERAMRSASRGLQAAMSMWAVRGATGWEDVPHRLHWW